MKSIFLTLALSLLIINLSTAQEQTYNSQYEAGQLLKKFSRQYYTGFGIVAGGYVFTMVGVLNEDTGIATFGSLVALGGTIFILTSFSKIGRAGEHLMIGSQNLSLGNKNMTTIGWVFNLKKKQRKRKLFALLD